MNKRRINLIISLCERLCEVIDEHNDVFWAQRPNLWSMFSQNEQKHFASVTKTEEEIAHEERAGLNELLNVLNTMF